MKNRYFLLLLASFCLLSVAAHMLPAKSMEYINRPINRVLEELVSVEIVGDNRGTLPRMGGWRNSTTYIEAQRGERFSIRVRNNSGGRIALAISVDGRNIISGEKSFNRPGESMYVLNPGQTGDFDGWRSSYSQVQRFYFTDESDSYSGRMGDYSQMGWIKVAAFRERQYYPQPRYLEESAAPSAYGNKRMDSASAEAGTGYGEGSHSPVSTTDFTPENFAAQLESIKYEWPEAGRHREPYYPAPVYQNGFAQPPR